MNRTVGAIVFWALACLAYLPSGQSWAVDTDDVEALGVGDTVRIVVFQNPDMTTESRISDNGTISFPLIGEVKLAGLTPSAAEGRIAELLKQGNFIINPQINLTVLEVRSREVSVLGEVLKPGKYPVDAVNDRLTDALAQAGGIKPEAADSVTIVRRGNEKIIVDLPAMFRSGDLSQNVEVRSGDIIYVPRAPVFYIYGEVQRPGAYRLEANMTVMQGLAAGGGITTRGTERWVQINRGVDGKVEKTTAKLDDPIHPNDVIYVRESLF